MDGTITSNETSLTKSDVLTDDKQGNEHQKQRHVSTDLTTSAEKGSFITTDADSLSQALQSPSTTLEAHFNRNGLPLSLVPIHQTYSPIPSAASSDTEIEGKTMISTRSATTTPSPTFNQIHLQSVDEYETLQTKSTNDLFKRHSVDNDRPPARLEQRISPLSYSPEQPNKYKEKNTENNLVSSLD